MCFRKWGSLVESYFCGNRVQLCRKERVWGEFVFLQTKNCFLAKWKVPKENVKFQFSAHENILDKSQSLYQLTSLLVSCQTIALHKTYHIPHWFPFSTAPNITCSSPYKRLLAASSPHCNFNFPQNPILRLIRNCPFAPVQNMAVRVCGTNRLSQKILMRSTFQILLKKPPHGFWTAPRESRGQQTSGVLFGYFFVQAKK